MSLDSEKRLTEVDLIILLRPALLGSAVYNPASAFPISFSHQSLHFTKSTLFTNRPRHSHQVQSHPVYRIVSISMVRLALLAVAASYASISYAGPIIIAPAANASAEINPQHASHALEALPPSPPVSGELNHDHLGSSASTDHSAPKVKRSALSTTNEDPFSGTRSA